MVGVIRREPGTSLTEEDRIGVDVTYGLICVTRAITGDHS